MNEAELEEKIEVLEDSVAELQTKLEVLGGHLRHAKEEIADLDEVLKRYKIVVYSKLTRRQQKMWDKWVAEVDLSTEPKLKSHFSFPKVGLQAMDRGKWVRLTGTAQSEGLTKEEGADICEYLNSFPENQHQLKNLDSEFRSEEFEARAKLDAEARK